MTTNRNTTTSEFQMRKTNAIIGKYEAKFFTRLSAKFEFPKFIGGLMLGPPKLVI